MQKNLKVSIITVCYNAEATIERTIKSVLSQTYSDIEYIIVDGKSTDTTMNIVNKYKSHISTIISEPDKGIYDAMNKGIRNATGDIIGIINADDWYEEDAVESIVDAFNISDAGLVYGKAKLIYHDQSSIYSGEVPLENLRYEVGIMHPTVFVKKDIYNKYGLFNLSYRISADYELFLRYYINKIKFFYVDKLITNFTLGGKSTTDFIIGVKETRAISLKYAVEYDGDENIFEIIEDKYKTAFFHMALQGPSYIIKDILVRNFKDCDKGIYIFGVGYYGKTFFRVLTALGITVNAYFDNNFEHQKSYKDIPVFNPQLMLTGNYNILIAVNDSKEIENQIKKYNNSEIEYLTISELRKQVYEICSEKN